MLKNFTFRLIPVFVFALLIGSSGLNAQEVIWGGPTEPNSTFADGLNDWTSNKVPGFTEAEDSVFVWLPNGDVSEGLIATAVDVINSPSASNGAAGMNLDLNTTGGTTNPGAPPYPYYVAELISPVIDLSATTVPMAITFYQALRHLNFVGGNTTFKTAMAVSLDGGTTWGDLIPLNTTVPNQARVNNRLAIPLPESVVGAANFRVKFVLSMDFYYWVIDDVTIEELPAVNVGTGNYLYTLQNTSQPKDVIGRDTLEFAINVNNQGQALDLKGTVEVINTQTSAVVHSQTKVMPVAIGQSTVLEFDDVFLLEGLEVGEYLIRYEIEDDAGNEDLDPSDNVKSYGFNVTENSFVTGANQTSILAANIAATGWGYGTSFWTPVDDNVEFNITQISTAFGGWQGAGDLEGAETTFFLVKKGPEFGTTSPSFSDFEPTQMEIVGFSEKTLTAADHNTAAAPVLTTYELQRFDFEEGPIELENGEEYFAIALVPFVEGTAGVTNGVAFRGTTAGFPNFVVGLDDDGLPISGFVYTNNRLYMNDAFSANFGGRAPYYTGTFDLIVSADAPQLSEVTFSVFPNPVSGDFVNLELNFDRPINTNVYITDINGKLFNSYKFNAAQTTEQLNVSSLAAGTYMVIISNEEGVGTKKITVIR